MTPSPTAPVPAVTADTLQELERLLSVMVDEDWEAQNGVLFGPNDDGTGIAFDNPDHAVLIVALRNNARALIAGCRAAGAATPPALGNAQTNAYLGAVIAAQGNAAPTVGDGAGAATPALTAALVPEERAVVDDIARRVRDGLVVSKAESLLLHVLTAATTGGVAAAPSPAATAQEPLLSVHDNADGSRTVVLSRGLAEASERLNADRGQRKEPTP